MSGGYRRSFRQCRSQASEFLCIHPIAVQGAVLPDIAAADVNALARL
jgi:hypothetical protein